jgi:hypothetical protein
MSLVLYSRSLLGPLIALHAFTLGIGLSLVMVILAVTVLAYGVPSYSGAKCAFHRKNPAFEKCMTATNASNIPNASHHQPCGGRTKAISAIATQMQPKKKCFMLPSF